MRTRPVADAIRKLGPTWELPEALAQIAVGGDELLAECDAVPDFVVDGMLEAGDLALLTGEEKRALKTWLLIELAIAVITGGKWLGRSVKCTAPALVLFISAETSKRNIGRRLRARCRTLNVDPKHVARHLRVVDRPITILPRDALARVREKSLDVNTLAAAKTNDKERRDALLEHRHRFADGEAHRLGRNLDALEALLDCPPGVWGLVLIDTVRACMEGDENSSRDAGQFTAGAREIARTLRCPVVASHHTSKSGSGGDPRSSRGSVELTAGPDALFTVDTSGDHPTMHVQLRNHESPPPVGYALVVEPDRAARIDVLPPCGRANDVAEDDVLAVLREHQQTGLTESKIRAFVAAKKSGKPGAKANQKVVVEKLAKLEAKGQASRCTIIRRGGRGTFEGWRFGPKGGTVEAEQVEQQTRTLDEAMGDPTDV
jgi:hypothetical protein